MGTASTTTQSSRVGEEFGLFTSEFFQNPYPAYRRMQTDHPVLQLADGLFVVSKYGECNRILRQPRRSRDIVRRRPGVARMIGRRQLIMPLAKEALVFIDEPEHGRTRRLMHQGLTPARVKEMGNRVPDIVESMISAAAPAGRIDVIGDLAQPLTEGLIVDLLGIPAEHRAAVQRHAPALTRLTEPLNDLRVTSDAARGARAMQQMLMDLIEARRQEPGDDLISALVHAESDDDGRLSTEQIVANCLLLLSNNEVTVGLIGNAVLALLKHPEHLARFRDDPAIREDALDELLRYDPPTPFLNRIAGEGDRLEGADVAPGDTIVLAIAAANRDPDKFPDPHVLDFDRPNSGHHLAFGSGVHYCLAAPLARLVALPAISLLLERCRALRLAVDEPSYRRQVIFHCLEELPVSFDAARA